MGDLRRLVFFALGALIEARAAGVDPEQALTGHWRQMLRFDVVGSAFAISVYLLLYYILVAFLVVYMATCSAPPSSAPTRWETGSG